MKTKLALLLAVLLRLVATAADDLTTALQKGLYEEEANQDLPAAIKAYESLLTTSDEQRKLAATALFRLGECYRKLGRTNDAVAQYQRVVRDFTDQTTLATLSRQNLRGLGDGMTTSPTGGRPAQSAVSAEAEELARTERILAQLTGWDLGQVRRLLPTVVPDADFERYDRLLVEAQEKGRTSTIEAREEWRKKEDEFTVRLRDRFDEVKQILRDRVARLRTEVNKQTAEASRTQAGAGGGTGTLTPAQIEAQRLLVERLEFEIKTAEAEVARANELIRQRIVPSGSADKPQANLLELRRQLVLARDAQTAVPQVQADAAQSTSLFRQLQDLSRTDLVRVLPTVAPDALLNSLLEQLSQAERKQAELMQSFTDTHPSVKTVEATLKQLNRQIAERIDGIMKGLELKAAAYRKEVGGTTGASAPTNEEQDEIRRIQALIKNSPDLIDAVNVEVTRIRAGESMVPKNGTLLHKAASLGQLVVAKFLLEQGADVGARDEIGKLPLHWAAGNGHNSMVELLLSNKADANAKISFYRDDGATPLHLAVEKGFRTVCETLLTRGADPNINDASGTPPIYSAVRQTDDAILRLLLARGAKVNPSPGKKNYTPLHTASSTNIAQILIENGAVVDALNNEDQSPLHGSAGAGRRDLVGVLLAAGANPHLKDKEGRTPLHLAASSWKAAVIAPLIARGANPNERSSSGGLPLDYLIRFQDGDRRDVSFVPQLETLQALLAGGADPNLTSVGNAPHLFRAVAEGLEDQVEALLKAGANPNATTEFDPSHKGQTALIQALKGTKRSDGGPNRTRSTSLVNLLLEYKADPNLSEGNGDTPLYFAIVRGTQDFAEKVPFVEALLKRGASIDGRNSAGDTPLAVAVSYSMKGMVELLLQHKADPNVKTGNGNSLLHLAAANRNSEILDALLTAGANPNTLNAQGLSALDYVKSAASDPNTGSRFPRVTINTPANFGGQPPSQSRDMSQSKLADRLRKAGARDWAPRPGQITVTRRSSGAALAVFTQGTNDWNRHSLLEVLGFTYFGDGSSFPFPDLTKLTITRLDPASGEPKEFTVDLPAKFAAEDCKADQWLEWGDLIDIPEGEHKLNANWTGPPSADMLAFTKCLARNVTLTVKGQSKDLPLQTGQWRYEHGANGIVRYYPERNFRLQDTVRESGMLLTSSDTARVTVKRRDAASGQTREWTFDLSKTIPAAADLWLRDGDMIEVPEK